MALYFIGLGLGDELGITLNGLDIIKKCDVLYLENYTSVMDYSREKLENFYGKKIILAERNLVERNDNEILHNAKTKAAGFLVSGDPLAATTHIDLFLRARKEGIECKVINNASVITAVAITGLQVYKFGKTTSIPFENENIATPYDALKDNLGLGMHTLFLLDISPQENKFLSINDAIKYLLNAESKKKQKIFSEKIFCVGCARIGCGTQLIKAGPARDLMKFDFGKPPFCLIVPGKLHFMEEEALRLWV